jgi:rhamnose transport system substrate-binding protein
MRPLFRLGTLGTLGVAVALAALAGCTSPSSGTSGTPGSTAAPNAPAPAAPAVQGTVKLGMMPKQKGIPYFNACEKGAKKAAEELQDVELVYDGPITDRSEDQSSLLDTWVTKQFNAVAVACNDPSQISTSLARARDEGLTVVTWDADADPQESKRQFFVNQAGVEDLARSLVDEMARQVGEAGDVAVVSSSPTAPNQSAWLERMKPYMGEKYPKMKIVTTEYAGENQKTSFEKAQNILKAYPNVKGIWGMTSVAFPGTAQAVEQAGKAGKVAVVGLGTPSDMKPFVKKGTVKTVILWNPVDLGYLTVYVARAVAKGELQPGAATFQAGSLGEKKIEGNVVLLGEPMVFTKENIDQFDF